ncbi:MAG: response regulator [Chloroflexi bacterium]|nr:response regulator [Chloroflexota bacterium]
MQRTDRTGGSQHPSAASRPPRPTAADKERLGAMRGDRNALSATSIVLAGPERWWAAVEHILAGNQNLVVAAAVECDLRKVDVHRVPKGDVVLIGVDGNFPNKAVEFAMRFQAKDRGTGIALVLPNMSGTNLRAIFAYAGSWSLISGTACGEPGRLATMIESAGRGISWVDPVISRLFEALQRGTPDVDEEFTGNAINQLVNGAEPAPGVPAVSPENVKVRSESSVPRILVTDDSEDVRLALQTVLEDAGYEVIEARDGVEGVAKAQSELPDLILLDVMMPRMDGFAALKAIKADPATKSIPVIMVTARGGRNDAESARSAGAFDYIKKPWSDGEVEMSVNWALSGKRASK